MQPELLRSATSRRNGFVYVIDIAPTILHLLGYGTPADMEGQTMEVVSGGVAHGDRLDFLIHANEEGVFRDSKVVTANNVLLALSAVLALVAFLATRRARRRAAQGVGAEGAGRCTTSASPAAAGGQHEHEGRADEGRQRSGDGCSSSHGGLLGSGRRRRKVPSSDGPSLREKR